MCELLMVVALTQHLMVRARERGASLWWAPVGPVLWFGGEFSPFVVGLSWGARDDHFLELYPFALGYAALGAWLARLIVDSAPVQLRPL